MTDHILGVDISKANLDVHLIPTGETQQFANSTVPLLPSPPQPCSTNTAAAQMKSATLIYLL